MFFAHNHDIYIYNLNTCCHSLQNAAKIHVAAHSMNPNIVVPWLCCPIQIRKGRDMSIGGAAHRTRNAPGFFQQTPTCILLTTLPPRRNKLIILNLDFCFWNPRCVRKFREIWTMAQHILMKTHEWGLNETDPQRSHVRFGVPDGLHFGGFANGIAKIFTNQYSTTCCQTNGYFILHVITYNTIICEYIYANITICICMESLAMSIPKKHILQNIAVRDYHQDMSICQRHTSPCLICLVVFNHDF